MTKQELITALAAKTGLTRQSAAEACDALLETIMDAVRDGDRVSLAGFGSFWLAERAARNVRNPQTGETIRIPVRKFPRFTPGKTFRKMAL